ncbi:MAG: gamma-glutamyl-gamma-aminobutyrate hydrolase family protein [Chloroflexota bacterium]|nr:MAG: gamma-glutamyl-gamma-aminobutyrate hydrolase [Chloroflexota bacterium]
MQPLIGITTASVTDERGLTYNRAYTAISRAVAEVGGLPVLIPTGLEESALRALYERLDGVLLPGGPDIDPSFYGEEPHPTTKVDRPRDDIEVPLARWSVEDDVPLFGICRGHQVINVALGGSLIQDIPSLVDGPVLPHDIRDGQPRNQPAHEVMVEPGSRLASILGETRVAVNSLHHQAVSTIAPPLVVTATSPDGLVEATEMPDRRFVLTVQWHPEDLYETDAAMLRLFREFVEAARERVRA